MNFIKDKDPFTNQVQLVSNKLFKKKKLIIKNILETLSFKIKIYSINLDLWNLILEKILT